METMCAHRVPAGAYCSRCAEDVSKAARPAATMDGKRQEGDGLHTNSGAAVTHFSAESAEEYTQSLSQIFAGSYRQILWAQQAGIPEALGLSTKEWVNDRLGGYIRMQTPERKKAVAELTKEGLSTRQIEAVIGADHATVARDVVANATPAPAERRITAERPYMPVANATPVDIEAESKTQTRKQRDLKSDAKQQDKAAREAAVEAVPEPDVREGTLSEVLADVEGVDLVLTDPPYPREFLPAWSELSEWAKSALKPGALLLAYSGQYHLPEVLERLSRHLTYQWLGWVSTTGPHVAVHQRPVMSGGKPLLVFSRGGLAEPFRSRRFYDFSSSDGRTRDLHTWEQNEAPAAYYMEALTERGELVVDPFLGSGTFALVAQKLGRRFIGCDVDAKAVETTRNRLDGQA